MNFNKIVEKNFNYSYKEKSDSNRWYLNDKLHRDDGPAVVWTFDGMECWYKHGKKHRDDGPAEVWHGKHKMWYKDGLIHREDGPAIEYADGTKDWYLNGKLIKEEKLP